MFLSCRRGEKSARFVAGSAKKKLPADLLGGAVRPPSFWNMFYGDVLGMAQCYFYMSSR